MKNWKFSIIEDKDGYKCLIRDGKPSECYKFDVRPCTSRCCAFHYDNETVTLNCMPQPTVYGDVAETVTEDQVKDYFKLNGKDGARDFYKYYKALGWKLAGKKVYDWKALADRWDGSKYKQKKNMVRGIPKQRLDCPTCGGLKTYDDGETCSTCDGRGWIYAE